MKVGITGATGQLGKLVVAQLKNKVAASAIVALVRTPEKATELGVEVRTFDYNQSEGLTASLVGVDTLLLISGSDIGQRVAQHTNVINVAKEAGVKKVVYTSLLKADTSSLSLASEHLATEEALKASGLAYTILRNGWYTENYLGSVPGALGAGALIGSAGEGQISSATREDYAAAAVAVLTSEGHEGKTYELAGDDSYTLADLAEELSKQTGKTIPYNNLTETEYVGALASVGLPESLAAVFASFDTGASKNDLFDDSRTFSRLIGRETTSLATALGTFLRANH